MMALAIANLLGETGLLFLVLLAVVKLASPRLRVLLFRATFILALLAPLAVAGGAPHSSLFSYPMITMKAAPADIIGVRAHEPGVVHDSLPAESRARTADHASGGFVPLWGIALLAIWLVGALAVFGHYIRSFAMLRRAAAKGEPAPAWIEEMFQSLRRQLGEPAASLRISQEIATPCAIGILTPRILLPTSFAHKQEILTATLAHEICHVRNRDVFWLMLGYAACSLYWFNPLIWMCASRHRDDVEIVCDDAATSAVVHLDSYIAALIHSARAALRGPGAASASMSALGVSERVRMLIDRDAALPRPAAAAIAAVYAAATAALVLFATTGFVAAQTADQQRARLAQVGHDPIPTGLQQFVLPQARRPASAEEIKLGPNETMLYIDAGAGVSVLGHKLGFMCEEASCKFTVPAQAVVALTVTSVRHVVWQGCAPSADNSVCVVQTVGHTAHVRAAASD